MNPSPHKARAARKRKAKPGTVADLTALLWRAIDRLEAHLGTVADGEEIDTAELCKLTHAISQTAGTYLKALEVGELEARLAALEKVARWQDKPAGVTL